MYLSTITTTTINFLKFQFKIFILIRMHSLAPDTEEPNTSHNSATKGPHKWLVPSV